MTKIWDVKGFSKVPDVEGSGDGLDTGDETISLPTELGALGWLDGCLLMSPKLVDDGIEKAGTGHGRSGSPIGLRGLGDDGSMMEAAVPVGRDGMTGIISEVLVTRVLNLLGGVMLFNHSVLPFTTEK